MQKAFKHIFSLAFLIFASHNYSSAQIIQENTIKTSPFESVIHYPDSELIYIGSEINPDNFKNEVALTKKDLNGNIIWKKTIDWKFDCIVNDARLLPDANIIIAGGARESYFTPNPFIMKINPDGDTIWTRYYQTGSQAENIIRTFDDGYLFSFYDHGSGLMKLDSQGDSLWYVGIGKGRPYGLAETSEAVYLLVDDEGDDIVLHSVDSDGEVLWKRVFGGKGKDQPIDVINASNGDDYLVAGRILSESSGEDFFIALLDCFGYLNWTKTFGGPGTDRCFDLMESSDGHFIAVGSSDSYNNDGRMDFFIVKFDTYGNMLWSKTFPNMDNDNYQAQNIFETSYGSYLLTGSRISNSNTENESFLVEFIYPTEFLISFEADKQTITSPPFDVQFRNNTANAEYFDFVWHFGDGKTLASNQNTISHKYENNGLYDVKLVARENDFGSVDSLVINDYIRIEGISTSVNNYENRRETKLSIYPNPFSDKTTISFQNPDNYKYSLRLYDERGRLVKEIPNIHGSSIELKRNDLPRGTYFMELAGIRTHQEILIVK